MKAPSGPCGATMIVPSGPYGATMDPAGAIILKIVVPKITFRAPGAVEKNCGVTTTLIMDIFATRGAYTEIIKILNIWNTFKTFSPSS